MAYVSVCASLMTCFLLPTPSDVKSKIDCKLILACDEAQRRRDEVTSREEFYIILDLTLNGLYALYWKMGFGGSEICAGKEADVMGRRR